MAWLRSKVDHGALSVQDFPAAADPYGVASNVCAMRFVLFDARAAIAIAALLPFVPIWPSAIPARTIIDHLDGLVLRDLRSAP
jgi:hypothetical protein